MKRIGIIGGLGPEATVDYYRRIVHFFHEHNHSLSVPEIVIFSADISELFQLVGDEDWDALVEWLLLKVRGLEAAGADFAVISANTPHIVFDRVSARSPLPLLSIVEATREHAQSIGLKRVGLLGTKFTMKANFFGSSLAKDGIVVAVPEEADQEFIHGKLVNEIELGIFSDETRQELLWIIDRMAARDSLDGIILGCTELPLVLDQKQCDLPLLNTTEIHVAAICKYCLGAL
jgi:aspartate racemase